MPGGEVDVDPLRFMRIRLAGTVGRTSGRKATIAGTAFRRSAYNREAGSTCITVNTYSGTLHMEIMKAVLGLEDGQYVVGEGFGTEGETAGELVFIPR